MTITERLFTTTIGGYSIVNAALANVIILRVCRQGLGYNTIIGSAPGNREAQYSDGEAKITFNTPFNAVVDPFGSMDVGEKVYVRYRY